MAQADGKIVMAGGTFTDFVLARFNADGSLDTGFGAGGKVTTDMGSGLRSLRAIVDPVRRQDRRRRLHQHSHVPPAPRLPDTFALARYNADGSLDKSFGTGGRVSGNVNGQAYAVAIQATARSSSPASSYRFDERQRLQRLHRCPLQHQRQPGRDLRYERHRPGRHRHRHRHQ